MNLNPKRCNSINPAHFSVEWRGKWLTRIVSTISSSESSLVYDSSRLPHREERRRIFTFDQTILPLSLIQSNLPSRSLLLLSVSISARTVEMGENYVEMVYDFDPSALSDDTDVDASAGDSMTIGDGTIAEWERKDRSNFRKCELVPSDIATLLNANRDGERMG